MKSDIDLWIYLLSIENFNDVFKNKGYLDNFLPFKVDYVYDKIHKITKKCKYDIDKIKIIIMHLLRLDFDALTYDISEVEDYFREIGFLEQFLQLKFNYLVIKDYLKSLFSEELLLDIEEKFLKM